MHGKPSTSIYFDTRNPLKSGKYPVRLRVNFVLQKGKTIARYFTIEGIELTKIEAAKKYFLPKS